MAFTGMQEQLTNMGLRKRIVYVPNSTRATLLKTCTMRMRKR